MWKILLNNKSSQTGLRSDVKLTCSVSVQWKEGLLFTLSVWEEYKCERTFWLQFSISGAEVIEDRVTRERETPGLLLFDSVRFHWKLHFLCVHTALPVERNYAHILVANHILVKPLHICEWEVFKRLKLLSLSISNCKSFLSFS